MVCPAAPPSADTAAITAAPATSTEAPPPKPFSRPTISGIEVILILSAATTPITVPIPTPMAIVPQSRLCENTVAAMANTMPSTPA